jgi:hypothetical protein
MIAKILKMAGHDWVEDFLPLNPMIYPAKQKY